jgi:hypothetical protein
LRFSIVYPGVAEIDCRDCQKYVYDLDYGNKIIDEEINQPIERDVPPECSSCPKGEVDYDFARLGLDPRNEKLYSLYRAVKIAGGVVIPSHLVQCEIFRSNLVLVEDIVESAKVSHKARIARMSKEGV